MEVEIFFSPIRVFVSFHDTFRFHRNTRNDETKISRTKKELEQTGGIWIFNKSQTTRS